MSKTEAAALALHFAGEARVAIARAKGKLAACHRKTVAGLMPKFDTDEEADAWEEGFLDTRRQLGD